MLDIIKNRYSVRTYNGEKLNAKDYEEVKKYLHNEDNFIGLLGNKINFKLVSKENEFNISKISSYGVIKNAPHYLIITVDNYNKNTLLDLGYVVENFVLFLTGLGLGSCWLSASPSKNKLKKKFDMGEDEKMPIIITFGYGEKASLSSKVFRGIIRGDKKKSDEELFFENNFSTPLKDKEQLEILQNVKYGPSTANSQSWRIIMVNGIAHLYIRRNPIILKAAKCDFQMIDMGIAISHYNYAKGNIELYEDNIDIKLLDKNTYYVISMK